MISSATGAPELFEWDTEENLTGVTNEKNKSHKFTYDHAGRIIDYDYDQTGRLITKTFETEEQETFNWDNNGNLLAIQSPEALIERKYDPANNLTEEKNGDFNVAYQYNPSGRRTERTTSHGNSVKYDYDPGGAVKSIQINDQAPVAIERNKLGQITKERFSEGKGDSHLMR